MRKVILGVAVSLDSFIEGPNGEYDWCFNDQDYGLTEFSNSVDALFMGRKTFDVANTYEGEAPWKGTTTYIFSRSLQAAPAGYELLRGDIAQIEAIKSLPGKNIWLFGGAEVTAFLMNHSLVDELWLSVHPILLGAGKPLFQGLNGRITTKLFETKTYETGLVSLKYQILPKPKTV